MQATERKERPIICSGEDVRGILDGSKTQTRRVIKPQPQEGYRYTGESKIVRLPRNTHTFVNGYAHHHIRCPYGKPGDYLWVRETFYCHPDDSITYRADADTESDTPDTFWALCNDGCQHDYYIDKWKPSIHMPRWASRILLEVTDVRAEQEESFPWVWVGEFRHMEEDEDASD